MSSVTPTTNYLINKYTQVGATPLTTVFTPPPACFNPLNYPTGDHFAIFSSSCAPFHDNSFYDYQIATNSWYSPGVCPHKYGYVATSIQHAPGEQPITLAVCCPPGVETWINPSDFRCRHTIRASDSTGFWSPLFAASASTAVIGRELARAPVSVAWRESDLNLFTPSAAPVSDLVRIGAITTGLSSGSNNPTGNSPANTHLSSGGQTQGHGHNSGLSPGAAAGIGVGVAVGTIAVIIALWCIFRRYKINFTKREPTSEPTESHQEYSAKYSPSSQAGEVAEAGHNEYSEADGSAGKAELPGDPAGWEAGSGMRSPI